MSEDQIARLKKLLNQKKATLTPQEAAEKQELSELWERERIRLHGPFDVWIDWWGDDHAGGSNFKTWAGKQFVLDLVRDASPNPFDGLVTAPVDGVAQEVGERQCSAPLL